VRIGVANQKIVVRIIELPVIEDPKELEAAVSSPPPTSCRCRSTAPCSTGRPSRSPTRPTARASASCSSPPAAT
jgi:hypothetical protein